MNPGLTEEGAKIATSLVDSLKTQPATIAMIIISFGLLAYTFYEGRTFNAQRTQMFSTLMERETETNKLLARCVVPKEP